MIVWTLVNRCPRCLSGCLLLLVALVVAWSWTPHGSGGEGRVLSAGEMTAVVGDTPTQWCQATFACDDGFVEGSQCIACTSTTARKVCCQVDTGASLCTATGTPHCGDETRWYADSYTTVSCANCTATV